MGQSRVRACRVSAVIVVLFSGMLATVGLQPVGAQVTAVKGSAFGYQLSVTLFGGTLNTAGPTPTVSLPVGGSSAPVTGSAPTGTAEVSPATFFTSGQIDVSTQGTPASGSVTSSTKISNLNTSQAETLTASMVSSTCTANGTGVSGSTTITGGTLQTDSGDNAVNNVPDHAATIVNLPANPAPNTTYEGHIHVGNALDSFRFVLNEQITNADGSLTVNAGHQFFLGSIARGDLIIGQTVCGLTGTPAATTTTTAPGATTTTTTAPGATTTSTSAATTTTAPTTTTTVPAATTTTTTFAATTSTTSGSTNLVAGGAYGYYVSVGLFGGAPGVRGPAPTVTLPGAGAASPVTDTAASALAQFGPATILSTGRLEVSTQGTPGGPVTSSAKVATLNTSGQEILTAAEVASTCSASSSGSSGSTTITGGKLTTSEGANLDVATDDTVVPIPANPAPNTTIEGKIETVMDTFRYVFNEQIRNADGSITVNAAHQYLLGPTAVGEVIIGQSRCGSTTVSTGSGSGAGGAQTAAGSGTGLASTGAAIAVFVAFALMLLVGGWTTTYWVGGVRWREGTRRQMPWPSRSLMR